MSRLKKVLLGIEILVAFGPVVFLMIAGTVNLPNLLSQALTEQFERARPAWGILASLAGGLAGLFALASVWSWIFGDREGVLAPRTVWICMCLGLAALVPNLFIDNALALVFGVIPIVVTIHFVYLARDYLLLGRTNGHPPQDGSNGDQ